MKIAHRIFIAMLLAIIGGGVASFALNSWLSHDQEHFGAIAQDIAVELLPNLQDATPIDPEVIRPRMRSLAKALRIHIGLQDHNSRTIAGPPQIFRDQTCTNQGWSHRRRHPLYCLQLPHARWLMISPAKHRPFSTNKFATIISILVVIGIFSLITARSITNRLRRLAHAVDQFGNGNLNIRAQEEGNDEITKVAREFNHSADRISALMDANKRMLAHASHELRTPLTRLQLAVDLVIDNYNLQSNDEYVVEIDRNIRELNQTIEEILTQSALSNGQSIPKVTIAVDQLLARYQDRPQNEATTITGADDNRNYSISVSENLLFHAIDNLIANAKKYGRSPYAINVSCNEAEGVMVITVSDHGQPINDEDQQKLFEPFFQRANYSEAQGGIGLGLSFVQAVAAAHSGTVVYQRTDDKNCFLLSIPLLQD